MKLFDINADMITKILLAYLVIGCLGLSLLICLHQGVIGDTAAAASTALYVNIDPFLIHYRPPITDPYLLDLLFIIPFQLLTNFSPIVLKLCGYAEFLALVGAVGYAIYWMTGDKFKALLTPLLFGALSVAAQTHFDLIVYHNIAYVLAIAYIVLMYDIDHISRKRLAGLILFSFVILFSDLVFFALFVIPYTIFILLKAYKNKGMTARCLTVIPAFFAMTAGSYLLKMVLQVCTNKNMEFNSLSSLPDIAVIGLTNVLGILNGIMVSNFEPQIILLFVIYLLLCGLLLTQYHRPKNEKYTYVALMMLTGSLIMVGGFMEVKAFLYSRFLIYPVLTVILLLFVGLDTNRPRVRAIIAAIALISFCINIGFVIYAPNIDGQNYALVGLLEKNNLTYGYADFEISETASYLSAGNLHILTYIDTGNGLFISGGLDEQLWIQSPNSKICVIVGKNMTTPNYLAANIPNATQELETDKYMVYVFSHDILQDTSDNVTNSSFHYNDQWVK